MSVRLHIDPVSGISGDMLLGALLDAGAPEDAIRADLERLRIDGWRLDVQRVTRHGLTGSQAAIATADVADHRSADELHRTISTADLPAGVASRANAVVDRLAVAEAAIHGVTVDEVHFHEVGALDTIIDIVGVCSAIHHLGVGQATCGPLPTGSGTVTTDHGVLPVPAPATLRVLERTGHVWEFTPDRMELVTPTGAALVAEFTAPATGTSMSIEAIGYGFGMSTRLPRANCVRVLLGTSVHADAADDPERPTEPVVVLQTTIDDQSPEWVASAIDACIDAGAFDGWTSPVVMKQRRLGSDVTIICPPGSEASVVDRLFAHTTTLGIRRSELRRYVAARAEDTVEIDGITIRVKRRAWAAGASTGWKPEHRDVMHAASTLGCTPAEISRRLDEEIRRHDG